MLHRWCILLALVALVALAGCGGGSSSQDLNTLGNDVDRQLSDTNIYSTELIAGAGQGWPASGTDVGEVTISQDGNTLTVEYCLADGYEFSQEGGANLHLYISEDWPPTLNNGNPTVAPGAFPYSATVPASDDCYAFVFSMSEEGWNSADTLYVAAHAVVCDEGEGDGGGDQDCEGYYEYTICDGDCEPFGAVTIWAGQTIDAGTAYLSVNDDGTALVVDIELNDDWEICEDQLWVGTTPDGYPQNNNGGPKIGQFPYKHTFGETPPNPTSDQFIVPFDEIDGFFWDGDMTELCMALHVTVCRGDDGEGGYAQGETGWAYCPGESYEYPIGWGGVYCFTICREWVDPDNCEGGGGGGGCETAWAFQLDGNDLDENGSQIGDSISENEEGWFPNLGFTRWGWRITYIVE